MAIGTNGRKIPGLQLIKWKSLRASLHVSVGKETSQGVLQGKLDFALSCGPGGWVEIQ